MLLGEVSITPHVFLREAFETDESARRTMKALSWRLLRDSLARDLCEGKWREFLEGVDSSAMHPKAKELLRKLGEQNRLTTHPSASPIGSLDLKSESAWLDEALAVDAQTPCYGTVVSPGFEANSVKVVRADRLHEAEWWDELCRSSSVRIERNLSSYREHVCRILSGARSIMLIDPYADPESDHYDSLLNLILSCRGGTDSPGIELHRVRYRGSGKTKDMHVDWHAAFSSWGERLRAAGVRLKVVIRSDFHDRYLLTDQIGIGLSNGLDLSRPSEKVLLSRLTQSVVKELQSDFCRNSANPRVAYEFSIGA